MQSVLIEQKQAHYWRSSEEVGYNKPMINVMKEFNAVNISAWTIPSTSKIRWTQTSIFIYNI